MNKIYLALGLGLLLFSNISTASDVGRACLQHLDPFVYKTKVQREVQNQSIYLNSVLNLSEYRGLEIAKIEVFGKASLRQTSLSLWVNDSIQNTEWMSKNGITTLETNGVWKIGENIYSINVYIDGAAMVNEIRIFFRSR